MQIVIDIDEERYNQIKRCADNFLASELERAIKNGTPISTAEVIPLEEIDKLHDIVNEIGKNTNNIKQLQDIVLIYGDKIILTITDDKFEYRIKDITGKPCAKYFEPSDRVSEAIIRISRK